VDRLDATLVPESGNRVGAEGVVEVEAKVEVVGNLVGRIGVEPQPAD